jgi:hypothetical protein
MTIGAIRMTTYSINTTTASTRCVTFTLYDTKLETLAQKLNKKKQLTSGPHLGPLVSQQISILHKKHLIYWHMPLFLCKNILHFGHLIISPALISSLNNNKTNPNNITNRPPKKNILLKTPFLAHL